MNELEQYLQEQVGNELLTKAIMARVEDLIYEAESRGYDRGYDRGSSRTINT